MATTKEKEELLDWLKACREDFLAIALRGTLVDYNYYLADKILAILEEDK